MFAHEFFYALTTEGQVLRMSCRKGAAAQTIGRFDHPATGANGYALVDLMSGEHGLRGDALIAVSPRVVELMVLATGERRTLFEPLAESSIVANASEAEAAGFRGIVATSDFCAFALRAAHGEFVLAVRYFSEDRRIDYPLVLEGHAAMGPALCGGRLVLCTDRAIGVYDPRTGAKVQRPLPPDFKPMFSRTAGSFNVPLGSIPLAVTGEGEECAAWVAGDDSGRSGLLRINFSHGAAQFRALSALSSVTAIEARGFAIGTEEGIEGIGWHGPSSQPEPMEPEMPVVVQGSVLAWFSEELVPGKHRVMVALDGNARKGIELRFEDELCDRNSCCDIAVGNNEVLAFYLDAAGGGNGLGLRFAHWSRA